MHTDDAVARYYDANTSRFLMVGGAGDTYAIHRQLWGEGVRTVRDAADHVHRLIEERALAEGIPADATVLDLGCGVGGTLLSLASAFPASRLVGVTISPRQARLARRLVARRGLGDRCDVRLDDFHRVSLDVTADLVVAIEAFAHSPSPSRFMATVACHLAAGGRMIVVDDFLVDDEPLLGPRARAHVRDFREGWRVPGVGTVAACVRAATEAGLALVADEDLTDLTRVGRPRDRAIAWIAPRLPRSWMASVPFVGNLVGGNALQVGLREGFVLYRMLTFRAREPE